MRILCVFAMIVAQVNNSLSRIPAYMELPMNAIDYLAFPCSILMFILLVKNGNKNLEGNQDIDQLEELKSEERK